MCLDFVIIFIVLKYLQGPKIYEGVREKGGRDSELNESNFNFLEKVFHIIFIFVQLILFTFIIRCIHLL